MPVNALYPTFTAEERTAPALPSGASLTPEFLASLRAGYRMSAADRACHNAVANNDLASLALNQAVIRGDDGHFSHRIKSKGIGDQHQSGRCWMFAGLNVVRPQLIRDHRMEEFEFSHAYLQFWDKMEKSNLYLESVIELRDADYLDRDWEMVNKAATHDGGWWNYVAALMEKHGVVPRRAMPETHASTHTGTLNEVLGRLLRAGAVKILARHADGADTAGLRAMKDEILKQVYRFLVINFGEPPTVFEWRYRRVEPGSGNAEDSVAKLHVVEEVALTPPEQHTPQSFYHQYVSQPLSEYVCLYNDPVNEFDRHYRFDRALNIVGADCMHFVNIGAAAMKEIATASILANEPVWFAVNMGFDQSAKHGVMEHQLFDYESLFGVDLAVSKADRTRFHAGASNHAMVIMGVDLDQAGQPRKWLVENSHGEKTGDQGRWTLHDSWFDEHVYTIIAHRRHVPAAIMECFEQEPVVLPSWYPGSAGVSGA